MNPGALLILEGLDGCGKTTQASRLAAALRDKGHRVLETREPTRDGHFGRRIRSMARSGNRVPPDEELRWFMEDRRFHVEGLLLPALHAGTVVVCDRYFLSTVAYQGARGLDWPAILAANESCFPVPDLTLLLEISPEVGLERVRARAGAAEPAFEDAEFLRQVAHIFGLLERPYLERIAADAKPSEIEERIRDLVSRRLGLL